jgi:hypothetical protein
VGQATCTGKIINKYRVFVNKPEGKRTLEKHKQENNIKTNIKERVCDSMDWV